MKSGLDDLEQTCDDPREDEANALASEVLIPNNIFITILILIKEFLIWQAI